MAPDANPAARSAEQRDADDERLRSIAADLAGAIEQAVPGWIERSITERVQAWRGEVPAELSHAAAEAGRRAVAEVVPRVRALLEADVDDQRTNPLALLRSATVHAHAVLASAGVPTAPRDEFSERSFPDDAYDLVPASWDEIDPALQERGIAWGAAKAYVFKARRREEGRR